MLALYLGAVASTEYGMSVVWSFTATFSENALKRLDSQLFNLSYKWEIKE